MPPPRVPTTICTGTTLRGQQCKLRTTNPNGRCSQHPLGVERLPPPVITLTQCQGIKKNQQRCNRKVSHPSGLCPSHQPKDPAKSRAVTKPAKPFEPERRRCIFLDCSTRLLPDKTICNYHQPWVDLARKLESSECAICLEPTQQQDSLRCGHQFHMDCLRQTDKLTCPVCRDDIYYIPSEIVRDIRRNNLYNDVLLILNAALSH